MTLKKPELRIDMVDSDGKTFFAKYDSFKVMPEKTKYKLRFVGTYSGNAGQ